MEVAVEFLKKVRSIELRGRRRVKTDLAGAYLSAFRGSGMQFREFRNYVYGDDVRHISWNVSARTESPVIKTFDEERERTLFLVVDVSASLRKGPWARRKAERLAEVVATLALSAEKAQDKIGLLLYSDRVERTVPPGKGRTHLLRIVRDVLAFQPEGHGTDPTNALKRVRGVLSKHAIVVLLSDLEALPDDTILRQVATHHELFAVCVSDKREHESLKAPGFLELETAEQGRVATVDLVGDSTSAFLRRHMEGRVEGARELYRRAGVDLLMIGTEGDFVPDLQRLFLSRRGQVK